jgi:hypothetical protein
MCNIRRTYTYAFSIRAENKESTLNDPIAGGLGQPYNWVLAHVPDR